MIHCGICGSPKIPNVEFLCAHCINGSPSILLRDKLKLLLLRQEVEQLKHDVGEQLEAGFAGNGQFGKQLQKLDVYNEKRRLIKLRQRVQLVKNKIDVKRNRYQELERYLKDEDHFDKDKKVFDVEEIVNDEALTMSKLSQVLQRKQTALFKELCQWFRIEKCDEDVNNNNNVSAYTIWGVPMINLKYSNEMDRDKQVISMRYIHQFINFSFNIWLFEGISDVSIENEQNVIQNYSQLIYDTLRLLQVRKLVSESVSIRDILIRYDLDGMIYYLSKSKYLSSLDDASNSYPPTLQNIKQLVASMIPSI
ncbi:Atg14p [Kluyveromyces lactis]|uniref:Autophagy-related protein 14 n=1 Tax=Kluyveromyces lactis (strain ATCC 8585 / CBS 2359 / DSM 70799 / NBRC 1267 / NRRL Y-1140 / WM37) TaxID=284590 RepID=ATG14_KLULA|nr:uncharacterized protein KLLA0_D09130g [Kluyveromyces lactis]Q6CRH0.1 RecName: Full=Autophagy-related protein 14 [Kluyveromyces lactis NRRL Y-1140]CAH00565.1 KLLA0D09130p [Kluyveromyces lactis]|eukprot:XP_453469.1 uncharacterized protein KLLA0_D09130g [Kluyveromyces lactis]